MLKYNCVLSMNNLNPIYLEESLHKVYKDKTLLQTILKRKPEVKGYISSKGARKFSKLHPNKLERGFQVGAYIKKANGKQLAKELSKKQ